MKAVDPEFILAVLRAFDPFDCDELLWSTRHEDAQVKFFVNCSDVFYWGTADHEEITPENLHMYAEAKRDLRAAGMQFNHYADTLFACRVRKMRPQTPLLKKLPPEILPLFLACGPERDPKEEG